MCVVLVLGDFGAVFLRTAHRRVFMVLLLWGVITLGLDNEIYIGERSGISPETPTNGLK